ncbi:hypothetical protein ACKWMY_00585 [Serratia sp. J2]|uniref:hypothetical protein n=1 Tax=Serratia sp. J2 TaxID=3386551 RepID=UPI003916E972
MRNQPAIDMPDTLAKIVALAGAAQFLTDGAEQRQLANELVSMIEDIARNALDLEVNHV